MNSTRSTLLLALVGLCLVVGPPFLGRWSRRHARSRCALEGLNVEPLYHVRITNHRGELLDFCCIECARQWLSRQVAARNTILVTDEASGDLIDASAAIYVLSTVTTNRFTGNCVHAFQHKADAAEHERAFAGHELLGSDRPFARWEHDLGQ